MAEACTARSIFSWTKNCRKLLGDHMGHAFTQEYATCITLGSSKSTILKEAGQLYVLVLGRLDNQNEGSFS